MKKMIDELIAMVHEAVKNEKKLTKNLLPNGKKKWYLSKTLWINVIAIAAIIIQIEYGFIVSPELELVALGIVNLILRKYTNEGLEK